MTRSLSSSLLLALAAMCGSFQASAAESTCGRISVFDTAPRQDELYAAVLIAVDGRLPGPSSSSSFRVSPGVHQLTVAESIDARQFQGVHQLQRDRAGRERYKTLELNVEPGVTYRLASQLLLDRRHSIQDNAYWMPVIWKQSAEKCG